MRPPWDGETLAAIYESYERQLAEDRVHDFDDLILIAVRALREDADLRRRWQSRFEQVLVDEYQDIEPAQELLVRILAAPDDGLFCVGDEDQTLYGWRRASVRRIIELELAYPGLQRVSLAHNYRCPPDVVEASRRLIEHNEIRFPKPIHAPSSDEAQPALDCASTAAKRMAPTRSRTSCSRTTAVRSWCSPARPTCCGRSPSRAHVSECGSQRPSRYSSPPARAVRSRPTCGCAQPHATPSPRTSLACVALPVAGCRPAPRNR